MAMWTYGHTNSQSGEAVEYDVGGTRDGQAVGKVEESHGDGCTIRRGQSLLNVFTCAPPPRIYVTSPHPANDCNGAKLHRSSLNTTVIKLNGSIRCVLAYVLQPNTLHVVHILSQRSVPMKAEHIQINRYLLPTIHATSG